MVECQLETAKAEVTKPFAQEAELAGKQGIEKAKGKEEML